MLFDLSHEYFQNIKFLYFFIIDNQ